MCECKEFIGKGDRGFIWNPSDCECEYVKSCHVGEYLNCENCKCGKRLIDKLVEEGTENIDEVKTDGMALFGRGNECKSSCTICVVLIAIVFTICIEINIYFVYYKYMNHWYLKNDVSCIKFDTRTQTVFNEWD